jgi:shikimate kinase
VVKFTSRSANLTLKTGQKKPFVGLHDGKPGLRNAARAKGGAVTARAIVLVGFMGAGKTAVGQELGRQLVWPFDDLDDRIQMQEGRSVERIFRESGEAEFRRVEHVALNQLIIDLQHGPRVIALGGGAFVQPNNVGLLESAALQTVFLNAAPEELFRRCEEQGTLRPLRQDRSQFTNLCHERQPQYRKAKYQIETTGKDVASVAREIGQMLGILS